MSFVLLLVPYVSRNDGIFSVAYMFLSFSLNRVLSVSLYGF